MEGRMENTMKLAGAMLIVVSILCGVDVIPASFELPAAGIILGMALAAQHTFDVISTWTWRRIPSAKMVARDDVDNERQ
jgi:hypothetical protein